jgi:hypothetical protein
VKSCPTVGLFGKSIAVIEVFYLTRLYIRGL